MEFQNLGLEKVWERYGLVGLQAFLDLDTFIKIVVYFCWPDKSLGHFKMILQCVQLLLTQ